MNFEHFEALEEGWDGDMAPPPSMTSIEKCRNMVAELISQGCPSPKVLADAVGGMSAIWRAKFGDQHKVLSIHFMNNDSMYLTVKSQGHQEIFEPLTTSDGVAEKLKCFLGGRNVSA